MLSAVEHESPVPACGPPETRLAALLRYELDPYFRDRARAVLAFLDLRPTDRILDCGCGKGHLVTLIRRLYPCEIVAVDVDAAALRQAASGPATPPMSLVRASVSDLPFAAGSFSKIVCSEVLEHVADDRRALRELHRVLAPGGVLALTVPNRNYPFAWDPVNRTLQAAGIEPIRRGRWAGMWTGHRRLYDAEPLKAMVVQAGFDVVAYRLLTRFCLPFTHNLIYGLGLTLLEKDLLSPRLRRGADRRFDAEPPSIVVRGLGGLTGLIDVLNRRSSPHRVSVGIALRLRKRNS